MRSAPIAIVLLFMVTSAAHAAVVNITIEGSVEFNQINGGVLGNVNAGDDATLTFSLDSDDFMDSANFPTRGYAINQDSFLLDFGASGQIGLQDPFPPNTTPYFVLRDNDPAVDGFFIANNLDVPFGDGVPLDQQGVFDQFANSFNVSYTEDTLSSLDILDAGGTYDFAGLKSFFWAVTDGPFEPLFIEFSSMTIEVVPAPGAFALLIIPFGIARRRRAVV